MVALPEINKQSQETWDIGGIVVRDRKRPLGDIASLAQSIDALGLLNPITITADGVLVAGYHRLEACKSLGWRFIPVHVVSLDRLSAELAEIDENLMRNELHWFDRDKQLARRKELYEELHPETKRGGDRRGIIAQLKQSNGGRRHLITSFVQNTSNSTNISGRTIREGIQRANAFTDEQGEILKQAEIKPTEALRLAHLEEPVRTAYIERLARRNVDNIPIAVPHISSKNNEWYTPEKYIQAAREVMGGIDLDPASCAQANETVRATRYYDIQSNGLDKEWNGRVWLNPPYGRSEDGSNQDVWSSRLIDQYHDGVTTEAILLVNAAVDTRWFQRLFNYPICFPAQRINFSTPESTISGSTHGSALVYFGPHDRHFADVFGRFGTVVRRW